MTDPIAMLFYKCVFILFSACEYCSDITRTTKLDEKLSYTQRQVYYIFEREEVGGRYYPETLIYIPRLLLSEIMTCIVCLGVFENVN